ncbi:MAG TPA: prolipoprotein diacylglyceryl transferase [Beijerinckia sp.]|jgi:phosphatidylglycerol:prolipoprotein diacylglycerol transferase|nr:prolipoprotein diacylglyceryl transferase [Beijerinckia sp.]
MPISMSILLPILVSYPAIDPVLINIGPFPIRWYALSYITGMMLGWAYARSLVQNERLWGIVPRPPILAVDDLLVYAALGVILGGRIGYVLFYNFSFYLAHPLEIPAVWEGGMSFHGGLAGTAVALFLLGKRYKIAVRTVADVCCAAVPIGLFLGRIANFIKPELWGRPTDVPWAMIFPGAGPLPRHPSQLYEAGLEGLVLFLLLFVVIRLGALQRPGLVTGLFGAGYGIARITCEFFREPDPQLGFLFGGATMGMLLSLPLVLIGAGLILAAFRQPKAQPA